MTSPRAGLAKVLSVLLLVVAAGCKTKSPHFQSAQDRITQIETGNPSDKPDYADYRYDDVLVELAQVEPSDPYYWKAKEWMQRIRKGREDRQAADEARKAVPLTESRPSAGLPSELLATEPPPKETDPLQPHGGHPNAVIHLLGFQTRRDEEGAYLTGQIWNRTNHKLRPQLRITALAKDGKELVETTGYPSDPYIFPDDRCGFSIAIFAYDPDTAVRMPSREPLAEGAESAPEPTPFNPADAALYRLEFLAEDGSALEWYDARQVVAR